MNGCRFSKNAGFTRALIVSLLLHGTLLASLGIRNVPGRTERESGISVYLAMSPVRTRTSPAAGSPVDGKNEDRHAILDRKEKVRKEPPSTGARLSAGAFDRKIPLEAPAGREVKQEIPPPESPIERVSYVDRSSESSIRPSGEEPGISQDHGAQITTLPSGTRVGENLQTVFPVFPGDPAATGRITPDTQGHTLVPAHPLYLPEPVYPLISRKRGEEGRVVLQVEVGVRGAVLRAEIEKSSSHNRLDRAALRAVKEAAFTPATESGSPVRSTTRVAYRFELEGR